MLQVYIIGYSMLQGEFCLVLHSKMLLDFRIPTFVMHLIYNIKVESYTLGYALLKRDSFIIFAWRWG